MDIAVAGDGPAVDAVEAALGDVEVNVMPVDPDRELLGRFDLAVVADAAGADAFAAANAALDRWVAVEVGGLGGHALSGVDAAVTAFEDACYDCLRARVAAGDPAVDDRPRGVRSAVRYAGALAGRRTIRLLSGDPVGDTVVEVPGPERDLLPLPGCDCGTDPAGPPPRSGGTAEGDAGGGESGDGDAERPVSAAVGRAERAIDDRLGVVGEIGERESFPAPYYVATVRDTSGFSDVRAAEFGGGVDADWDRAFMKAAGEGFERYAAGVYRADRFERAPTGDVAAPVVPERFVRPDDAATPDPDGTLPWVEGEALATGEPSSLPAPLVFYPPPEPRLAPPITTGLGLGGSGTDALLSGLYEVIERDATMLAWYSTFEPLRLGLDGVDDGGFAALEKRARAESLSVVPLLVTVDVDVPVVAVGVSRGPDGDWPRFAAGSAANLDPAAAARSALAEAIQNWMELRAMGPERAADEGAAIGEHADLPDETATFFDPDGTVPAGSLGAPELSGTDELDAVVDRVTRAGLEPHAARLTTRDLDAVGFEAARVLVPAAQPLFTDEPYFGERARTVPPELGYEPRLDRTYHPFP